MHRNPLCPLCGTCRDETHKISVGCLQHVLLPFIEPVSAVLLCAEPS